MSFFARLDEYARRGGEAVAGAGVSLDWAALLARVDQGAAGLVSAGIGPGAMVGIAIADEVEHFVACLALLRAGAWQIALATHDPEPERQAIAARAGVTHVLHMASEPSVSGGRHLVWPLPGGAALPAGHPEGGVMLRTSGTTGTMNIVPLSAAELLIQADRNREYASGRLFRPASIEHNNSKRHRLYCAALGGTNVFRPHGAFDTIDYCRQMGVTTLDLALMQAVDLAAKAHDEALKSIDVRVSGSAVPLDARRQVERNLSRQLYVRYGSTESGTVSFAGPGEHETELVGRVVEGIDLQVVDAAGNVVAPGAVGHIRMRGEGIAKGYFGGAEQTARRFRDGWYWPGDMGSLDAEGRLTIHGRADDMINLNGVNIFPAEIEQVLETHPAVEAAAALPLASGVHGQIPVAAVELRPGGVVSERELVAYAREHLALRAPRRIVILDRLPRNDQGKILRRQIAEQFANGGSMR
jgi:acyl-CoA synthetase (AMP-forming)/AMP-acid ligase II